MPITHPSATLAPDRMEGSGAICMFVVDDESSLAELASHILALRGYEARVFSDPQQALAEMKTAPEKPSLLITDCLMDRLNGFQLIEEFKKIAPGGKTVLMSGTVTNAAVQNASVRPDRFIQKPYAAETLLDAVDELLRSLKQPSGLEQP